MTDIQQEKILQAEKTYALFGFLQYVLPLFLLGMALLLPGLSDLGEARGIVVALLCLFAVMDFFFFRFVLLPRAKDTLQRARDEA